MSRRVEPPMTRAQMDAAIARGESVLLRGEAFEREIGGQKYVDYGEGILVHGTVRPQPGLSHAAGNLHLLPSPIVLSLDDPAGREQARRDIEARKEAIAREEAKLEEAEAHAGKDDAPKKDDGPRKDDGPKKPIDLHPPQQPQQPAAPMPPRPPQQPAAPQQPQPKPAAKPGP